ncbi:Hypothetical predicted protein [Paramuricea clavata]|uniref:Uncharacterized protein n=1 Tax=Paramuricea clavata TaxID=317549 RepID=A0A6S7G9E5_PARCT|nr:Hypothetical predicted protein [Paramuricea clavata]
MAMKFQVLLCAFALLQLSVGAQNLNEVEQSPEREKKNVQDGSCQWGVKVWYKPGISVRCNCMKCTCAEGKWNCEYAFEYCPHFSCGGEQYSPNTEVCCCGKVYTKKSNYSCCGYSYYNRQTSKCCNYYTVLPKAANCPRYQI